MFDEHTVMTILMQHFPQARQIDIAEAAKDLLLFDLLADDRIPVWEDSMRDAHTGEHPHVFIGHGSRES